MSLKDIIGYFKHPMDMTPEQLQVHLHNEKQTAYYVFVAFIGAGGLLAAKWPAFAGVYGTYGGFLLAGLGLVFGVNVMHKALNNKAAAAATEDELEVGSETPKPSKT